MALSADGGTAIAGVPDTVNGGQAAVFTRSGENWTQQGPTLTGGGESGNARFGAAVALSGEGNAALIGGPEDDGNLGAAWLFTRAGETWSQQGGKLTAHGESSGGQFGSSVALSANGRTALISGEVAREFTRARRSSTWAQLGPPIPGANPVALSADADAGLVGSEALAQASSPPERGRCVKLAAEPKGASSVYTGWFTTSTCVSESVSDTGRYEWEPGAVNDGFALAGGRATLETVSRTKLTCNDASGSGELDARALGGVVLELTGCESDGHACTTAGLAAGELETQPLEGELGWEDRASGKAALDLFPASVSGLLLEYRCVAGTPTTLSGSVVVPVKTGKTSATATLKFQETRGVQRSRQLEGEPEDVLTASLNGEASEQVGLEATLVQTSEEPLEIRVAG